MTDYSRSYQQFGVGFTDKFNVISGFYSSWTTGNHPVSNWLSLSVTLKYFKESLYWCECHLLVVMYGVRSSSCHVSHQLIRLFYW